jgi:hypothetical protein
LARRQPTTRRRFSQLRVCRCKHFQLQFLGSRCHVLARANRPGTVQLVQHHQRASEHNACAPTLLVGHISRQAAPPSRHGVAAGWRGEATTDAGPRTRPVGTPTTSPNEASQCDGAATVPLLSEAWSTRRGCRGQRRGPRATGLGLQGTSCTQGSCCSSVPWPQGLGCCCARAVQAYSTCPPRAKDDFFPCRALAATSSIYRPTVRQRECSFTPTVLLSTAAVNPVTREKRSQLRCFFFSSGPERCGRGTVAGRASAAAAEHPGPVPTPPHARPSVL